MKKFDTYYSKESCEFKMEQVFDIIKNEESLCSDTALYRELMAKGQKAAADEVKKSTPQLAVSFNMDGGKSKTDCRECLYQLMIDFDAKAPDERLPEDELERVKTIFRTSYHTRLGYESISGLGYHSIVGFRLPEGVDIDMINDPKRGEQIYKRVYRVIANIYSVWCKHPVDMGCDNINRLAGLSHDPMAVYRPDAMPFCLTREELGIDADGNLVNMRTQKKMFTKEGKRMSIPMGDKLEQAIKMVEQSGLSFGPHSRHDYVMRVCFILNRLGVDEDSAALAVDEKWGEEMKELPSKILHSCYKTAENEYGVWMQTKSKSSIATEVVAEFLKNKTLKYDVLTQKSLIRLENGIWVEMNERRENDLYVECCSSSAVNIAQNVFRAVLNSSLVPEVNPLKEYVMQQPAWTPGMPDYITQVANQVHMATEHENELWQKCFKKWFVAMVSSWMNEDAVNHQVITLVGKQGIYKSTWIRRLLPPELKDYVSDMPDIKRLDKDEQLRAAEYGLVNLDELDALTDYELNKLKSAVTAANVNVRASYGHHKERRVRVASYAASGNKKEFLTDHTGNRRWLPFNVVSIDSPYENPLPYAGMYAQALYLINDGFNYWFDLKEIDEIRGHVEEFMVTSPEEQLVLVYFSPVEKDDPNSEFLTVAEISSLITSYGMLKKEIDPRRLGAILKKLNFKQARNGHNGNRGYLVRKNSDIEIKMLRSPSSVIADNADNADNRIEE